MSTRERPIIFSGPMATAILRGEKSQTRRIVKPQQAHEPGAVWVRSGDMHAQCRDELARGVMDAVAEPIRCPYGQPGDRLWVRESYRVMRPHGVDEVQYKADWKPLPHDGWKPSIHMPRWASRLTLEIVSVRVERLQDISEGDAIAEGWEGGAAGNPGNGGPFDWFRGTWDSINAKRGHGWDTNPFVWVVTFKQVTP